MQSYFDILNSDVLISIFIELTSNDMNNLFYSQIINFNDINFKDLYQRFNNPIIRQTWSMSGDLGKFLPGPVLTYHRCDKVLETRPIFKSKFVYQILSYLLLDLKNEKLLFECHYTNFIKFFRSLDSIYLLYTRHRELYDIMVNCKYEPIDYVSLDWFGGRREKIPMDNLLRNSSSLHNSFDINDLFNFIDLDIIKVTDYFFREAHTITSQYMFMDNVYKSIAINKENTIKLIEHIMNNYSDRLEIYQQINICEIFIERKSELLKLFLKYNIKKYLAVNNGIDELIRLKKSAEERDEYFFSANYINLTKCGSRKTKDQIYADTYNDHIEMIEILKEYFIQSERSSECFKIINDIFEIIDNF